MAQLVSKQFHAALTHFLSEEGRGAQARLALEQQIDRGYLNAITKGRKAGSDKIREKIADHFGVTFEDMLSLGRRILDGEKGRDVSEELVKDTKAVSGERHENLVDLESHRQEQEILDDFPEKIATAAKILGSNSAYGDFLASLNKLLQASQEVDAVKKENDAVKEDNLKLQKKVVELEERLASVERMLTGENEYSRKTA